ncbi:MAG: metal-dependent hydrolase [Haloarculaceae archaeon]
MWPWEHLAVGYLTYSLARRAVTGRAPARVEAYAVLLGSQFPDLVDKPLGWGTSLLPSGVSLAHSLLVAVPLAAVATVVTSNRGRRELGAAFAVGYLLHLPADALYPALLGGNVYTDFLLWPLVPVPSESVPSIVGHLQELIAHFLEVLATPAGAAYLVLEALLLGSALALWILDGHPGVPRRTTTPEPAR